ncbi:diaminopimelate epimerase [Actinomarinicola tropica]|nr:diaminopimelate epimerase [Actinomarinicola tropica]
MRISKLHGLRNDFLVLLDEHQDGPLDVGPELARRLCDRRSGLGADGLIHGTRPDAGSDADVVMHLFNADGSRAEVSGNGIRCLAQAVARSRGAEGRVVVVADSGRRETVVRPGTSPSDVVVEVDLGPVGPGPGLAAPLPLAVKESGTADLGNPHVVAWLDLSPGDLRQVDLAQIGPAVESSYPEGINLELIVPGPDPDVLVLRVWERGVGITEACGSGACAAAALAHGWGLVGPKVRVEMPGGAVDVELVEGRAVLHGPSVLVAEIELREGAVLDG